MGGAVPRGIAPGRLLGMPMQSVKLKGPGPHRMLRRACGHEPPPRKTCGWARSALPRLPPMSIRYPCPRRLATITGQRIPYGMVMRRTPRLGSGSAFSGLSYAVLDSARWISATTKQWFRLITMAAGSASGSSTVEESCALRRRPARRREGSCSCAGGPRYRTATCHGGGYNTGSCTGAGASAHRLGYAARPADAGSRVTVAY